MYLTAQRVFSPHAPKRGVNVFKYVHGPYSWPAGTTPTPFLPDVNVGQLTERWVELEPGGNSVLSYLDVVVPDDMPNQELCNRLAALKHVLKESGNPTTGVWGQMWIRFGNATSVPWSTELGALAGMMTLRLQPLVRWVG